MNDCGIVSIITPTYNCGAFIADTILSVKAQTYPNWEMIIVDDCSTDSTKLIVNEFAKKDSRIKYICLDINSGAAVARNVALKNATGKWIAFLDSDDLWTPDKLQKQICFMIENNYSFSYHDYSEINEIGETKPCRISGPKHITKFGMFCYCWPGCLTVMYNRQEIGLIQINPIKKNNDYAMWLEIIRKTDCFLMKDNCAFYRKRGGSISNHSYTSLIKWHVRLFKSIGLNRFGLPYLLTLNNLFWGFLKKLIYVRSI